MSILSNDDFNRLSVPNPEAYLRGTGRPAYYDKKAFTTENQLLDKRKQRNKAS